MSHTNFTPVAIQLRQAVWNDTVMPNDTTLKMYAQPGQPTFMCLCTEWCVKHRPPGKWNYFVAFLYCILRLIGWRRSVRLVLMKTYQWSGTVKVIPGPEAGQRCYLHVQPSLMWLNIWCNVIRRKAAPFTFFFFITHSEAVALSEITSYFLLSALYLSSVPLFNCLKFKPSR